MRVIFLANLLFYSFAGLAQEGKNFAILGNAAQLPFQCYELNGLLNSKNSQFQLLGALSYTDGYKNDDQHRNKNKFDPDFMKKASDKIQGWGVGGQLRYKLKEMANEGRLFAGVGINYYNYKLRFYENEYVEDQPPFYHYTVVTHFEKFKRIAPDIQLIYSYAPRHFYIEAGLGIAYNKSMIPASLEYYRTYHTSNIDYGFTGFGPAFSLRMGAWIL